MTGSPTTFFSTTLLKLRLLKKYLCKLTTTNMLVRLQSW
jgi:hypothetical protein